MPAGFAADHLVPALAPLLRSHSALRLRLLVTDERIDLVFIQERLDLALTIGRSLPSSSLVRHHLADWDLGLYGSPAYLATLSVDALMPARPRQAAKVRMAIQALEDYLKRLGSETAPRRRRPRGAGAGTGARRGPRG